MSMSAVRAVVARRSTTPHSRSRLPKHSIPIRGAAGGSSSVTRSISTSGNRMRSRRDTSRCCVISIARSRSVVSRRAMGGWMMGDERHVGVGGDRDGSQQVRRELSRQVDSGRTVGAPDDRDRRRFAEAQIQYPDLGENQRPNQRPEDAELRGRSQEGASGDSRAWDRSRSARRSRGRRAGEMRRFPRRPGRRDAKCRPRPRCRPPARSTGGSRTRSAGAGAARTCARSPDRGGSGRRRSSPPGRGSSGTAPRTAPVREGSTRLWLSRGRTRDRRPLPPAPPPHGSG